MYLTDADFYVDFGLTFKIDLNLFLWNSSLLGEIKLLNIQYISFFLSRCCARRCDPECGSSLGYRRCVSPCGCHLRDLRTDPTVSYSNTIRSHSLLTFWTTCDVSSAFLSEGKGAEAERNRAQRTELTCLWRNQTHQQTMMSLAHDGSDAGSEDSAARPDASIFGLIYKIICVVFKKKNQLLAIISQTAVLCLSAGEYVKK